MDWLYWDKEVNGLVIMGQNHVIRPNRTRMVAVQVISPAPPSASRWDKKRFAKIFVVVLGSCHLTFIHLLIFYRQLCFSLLLMILNR